MKNVLFVAPGLTAPWTEGRKNFIRDLIPNFQKSTNLKILTTGINKKEVKGYSNNLFEYTSSSIKQIHLFSLYLALKDMLKTSARPDIIIHFPYGSFNGLRGIVNYFSIDKTYKLANAFGVPCLTVLYSMAGGNLLDLYKKIPDLATVKDELWPGHVVHVGINVKKVDQINAVQNKKKLIFIAGYHENKHSLLDNILYDRGLIDILHIGEQLFENGFSLTISIPLLRHQKLRKKLLLLLQKKAPSLPVTLEHEVDVHDSFSNNSLFIFPFRVNYNVFVPTSVLEAMSYGVPVIISDLPMFVPLIGTNNTFCGSYAAGKPSCLLETILQTCENWDQAIAKSKLAQRHVAENWSIEKSTSQLIELVDKLTKNDVQNH